MLGCFCDRNRISVGARAHEVDCRFDPVKKLTERRSAGFEIKNVGFDARGGRELEVTTGLPFSYQTDEMLRNDLKHYLRSGSQIEFKQVSDFIFLFSGSNFAKENWMGWEDSNLRMTESKSVVLPLDDTPTRTMDALFGHIELKEQV